MAIEAWRIAIKYRTPVIFLSDGYLGTGSEPWLVPDIATLPTSRSTNFATGRERPSSRTRATRRRWRGRGRSPARRARAPHRRPGEGRHHRQRQLRPGEPRQDGAPARPKIERIAGDIPDARGVRAAIGRSARARLGQHLRRDHDGRPAAAGRGQERLAWRTCATSTRFPTNPGRRAARATGRCSCRRSTSASSGLLIRGKYLVDAVGLNKVSGRRSRIAEVEGEDERLDRGACIDMTDPDATTAPTRRPATLPTSHRGPRSPPSSP